MTADSDTNPREKTKSTNKGNYVIVKDSIYAYFSTSINCLKAVV